MRFRSAGLSLLLVVMSALFCAAQQPKQQALRLTVRQAVPKTTFVVELSNSGSQPVDIQLHQKYPDVPEATEILLWLTDSNGTTVALTLHDPCVGSLNSLCSRGQVSDIHVTLKPGESHLMTIDLEDYASADGTRLSLAPGRYTLHAAYAPTSNRADRVSASPLPFSL